MRRLGIRGLLSVAVLLPLVMVSGVDTVDAGTVLERRPFVAVGTVTHYRSGGIASPEVLIVDDLVDGTENIKRMYAARGELKFDVSTARKQASAWFYDTFEECGEFYRYVDPCAVGSQVDVLGYVEDRGPLGDVYVPEIVRPMSGLGVTTRTSMHIVRVGAKEIRCSDGTRECTRFDGLVASGPYQGWDFRFDYYCGSGFHGTWRLSRYGTSLYGTSGAFYDPLIPFESAEDRSGRVLGGTDKYEGARGAGYVYNPRTSQCGVESFDLELAPVTPAVTTP